MPAGPKADKSHPLLEDVLFDHKWVDEDYIGLDHIDRRRGPVEKGVFIRCECSVYFRFDGSSTDAASDA